MPYLYNCWSADGRVRVGEQVGDRGLSGTGSIVQVHVLVQAGGPGRRVAQTPDLDGVSGSGVQVRGRCPVPCPVQRYRRQPGGREELVPPAGVFTCSERSAVLAEPDESALPSCRGKVGAQRLDRRDEPVARLGLRAREEQCTTEVLVLPGGVGVRQPRLRAAAPAFVSARVLTGGQGVAAVGDLQVLKLPCQVEGVGLHAGALRAEQVLDLHDRRRPSRRQGRSDSSGYLSLESAD